MKGRKRWSKNEIEILQARYANEPTADIARDLSRRTSQVYQRAIKMGLRKSLDYLNSPASGRLRHADTRGGSTRFQKGQAPVNKGLRRPGWAPGRMAETQFKKGYRTGAAQHNYVPIGSERISKDGYLERKVSDDPGIAPTRRWTGVHRIVWEAANGPVPKSHAVIFLPGRQSADASLITLDALELVTRAELMRRNTIHRYPPELKKVIRLIGKLKRVIEDRV